jgi:hypothetical protein
MARNTEDKPRSIIKKAQIDVSKEAAARLKRRGPSTQMINRIRSTEETCGSNPDFVADIQIASHLTLTYNKEPFVWKDSWFGDDERVIVFMTESNLKLLIKNKDWFGHLSMLHANFLQGY